MYYSEEVFRTMLNEIDVYAEAIGKSKNYILEMVYNWDNKRMSYEIETVLKQANIHNANSLENVRFMDAIDIMHSYTHAIRFLVEDSAFGKDYDVSLLKKLEQEDVIIDFNHNFYCKISKNRYKLLLSEKYEDCYKFTILIKSDEGLSEPCTIEGDFVLSKLPRFFLDYGYERINSPCNFCKGCSLLHTSFKERTSECDAYQAYILGKNRRLKSNCFLCSFVKTQCGYSFDEIFGACMYAISTYVNRRKRVTDKSELNGIRVYHKVHEPRENKSFGKTEHFISIKEYNSYERKAKREYQGGHHSSPVEHERRSHLRHYKNGKVIEVKGSTVNKGNTKGVYRVN